MTVSPKKKEMVAVGISVAGGCKPYTDHHVTVARKARATDEDIRQIVKLAVFIKGRAASHVEKLVGVSEKEVT